MKNEFEFEFDFSATDSTNGPAANFRSPEETSRLPEEKPKLHIRRSFEALFLFHQNLLRFDGVFRVRFVGAFLQRGEQIDETLARTIGQTNVQFVLHQLFHLFVRLPQKMSNCRLKILGDRTSKCLENRFVLPRRSAPELSLGTTG